jgi:lysophospholipase L1-like esterase
MNVKQNILSGIIIFCILLFLLAISEGIVRYLTNTYVLSYYKPFELVKRSEQTQELRFVNVFSGPESDLEYDPVLFWRPKKNWGMFNELGLKGPSIQSMDASPSCTIATYGDSNTQSLYPDISWPGELSSLLHQDKLSIRVLNTGVMGYSSYQGLQKFRQDISVFHPSLIFVSFGWNDACHNMGIPDKEYATALSSLLSPLNRSRLFQVIKYYTDTWFHRFIQKPYQYGPRVSFEDYRSNLIEFIHLAKVNNISVVLLTQPHIDFSGVILPQQASWYLRVPEYNNIAREIASEYKIPMIDLEKIFLEQYPNKLGDDVHFTKEGLGIVARLIHAFLKQQNLLCTASQ